MGWISFRRGLIFEYALSGAGFAGLVYSIYYLFRYHYLPQPFFYEVSDTWMDWFNTAYWSHNSGTYDIWSSIYPPISFLFLKITTIGSCYSFVESTTSRDCDWLAKVVIHGVFVLNVVLTAMTYYRIDKRTALPRSFAVSAGLPMLYALDRGNLVMVCYTCVLLGFGPLLPKARLRWLFAGMAVNFKVYLIAALFPQLLRRRWRWFEGALLSTVAVYLVTYLLYGSGTPYQIFRNIIDFSGIYQAVNFLDLTYSGTYTPLLSLLSNMLVPTTKLIGSDTAETLSWALPLYLHSVQAMIVLACAAAWLSPEVVPIQRLTLLGIMMALVTAESGGYTQPLFLFFVFMEPWKGPGRIWALIVGYLLCIPADIPLEWLPPLSRDSYLGQRPVAIQYMVSVGPFLRPGLILSIPLALSLVTLREVWVDGREKGWAGRRRFAKDANIFAGDVD